MKKQNFLNRFYPPPFSNRLKYSYLAFTILFIVFIAGSLFINGCNKDTAITDPEISFRNTSSNSTSAILNKINFDQNGNILLGTGTSQVTLQHASIEYQRELSAYLFDKQDRIYWDSIGMNFGYPMWELAVKTNTSSPNGYLISVPFFKDSILNAIIVYYKDENYSEARFITRENIEIATSIEREIQVYFNNWHYPVYLFQIYDYLTSGNKNEKWLLWLERTKNSEKNGALLTDRAWCIEVEVIEWYTAFEEDGEIVYVQSTPYYTYSYSIVYCSGPPAYLNTLSSINTTTIPDGPPRGNGNKNLYPYSDCVFKSFDFMANEKVIEFLENKSLIEPCNPEKSTNEIIQQLALDACIKGVDLENLSNIDKLIDIIKKMDFLDINSVNIYSELTEIECIEWKEPCWNQVLGEHKNEAKRFDAWCAEFEGFSFEEFQSEGWIGPIDSQGNFPNSEWRYVRDPTNENYVIDMRHFLFVGFYLQQLTGVGNFAGDMVEFGQLLKGYDSALNWQDYFSNRLGVAFHKWIIQNKKIKEINSSNFASLICDFLDSPFSLNQRPVPNPQNCK